MSESLVFCKAFNLRLIFETKEKSDKWHEIKRLGCGGSIWITHEAKNVRTSGLDDMQAFWSLWCCQGSSGPIRTARTSSVLWWAVSYWATGIFFTKMFPEWKAFQFITGYQLSRTQGNLTDVFILQNSMAVLTMACAVPELCCFFIIVGVVRGKSFYSSGFRGKGKGPGVGPNPRSSVKLCGS